MPVVGEPFFRGGHGAGGAGQEPRAKLVLELLDLLADCGLVQVEPQGALGEAAALHHLHERAHRIEPVHGMALPSVGQDCL